MSKYIALACMAALATPALAEEWQNIGMDFDVDLQSVAPDVSGFTALTRHTDLRSEGLPPPAVSAKQHYRFDCIARTYQGLDVFYFDASGKALPGGGPYPQQRILPVKAGSFPDRSRRWSARNCAYVEGGKGRATHAPSSGRLQSNTRPA